MRKATRTELWGGNIPVNTMWVPRSEITELSEVKERIGLLPEGDVVYIIQESDDAYLIKIDDIDYLTEPFVEGYESTERIPLSIDHTLLKTHFEKGNKKRLQRLIQREKKRHKTVQDIWKKQDGWFYKWVPKDEIFVYNETDEPLRY